MARLKNVGSANHPISSFSGPLHPKPTQGRVVSLPGATVDELEGRDLNSGAFVAMPVQVRALLKLLLGIPLTRSLGFTFYG
jgi:hypothetical protein